MIDEAGRVILVDDRPERRRILREIFLAAGVPMTDIGEADDLVAAAEMVETQRAEVVVMERQLPLREGVAAIARLRDRFPQVRIAVCSFDKDPEAKRLEIAAGVDDHLDKPMRTSDARRVARRDRRIGPPSSEAPLTSAANRG